MKNICLALCVVPSSLLLNGCASAPSETHSWNIEPKQTIHHATNRPDGFYQLGRYYQGQDRLALAAEAYQKALAIDPGFTEAHNGLATIYAIQGKYEQAHQELKAAIATAPDAARLYNNLGYLNFLEGRNAEAIAAFTKATELEPANQKAWNNLGMALAKGGEPVKANQAFVHAKDSTTESTASAQSRANEDSNRVAPSSEEPKVAPMLALPKDRGVIVYASSSTPAGKDVGRPDVSDKKEDKMLHAAKPAQPAPPPPFAVLVAPNPKAMPVIVLSGGTPATLGNAPQTQPKPLDKAASTTVAAGIIQPANVTRGTTLADEKTVSKIQPLPGSDKLAELKKVSMTTTPADAGKPVPMADGHSFKLMVSNGNGVTRMAAKFGSMLSAQGFPKARLTNQKPYTQTHTVIQYQKGYLAEATRLDHLLKNTHKQALLLEKNELPSRANVRLVLGKDLSSKQTWAASTEEITLASR